MQSRTKYYLLSLLSFLAVDAKCQNDVYVHGTDSVHLFQEDSMSVWSNFTSNGVLESDTNSDVVFYGERWTNQTNSRFPGDGRYAFIQPAPAGGLNVKQEIGGVIWNNSLPNLRLDNPNDLDLFGDVKVRDTFEFSEGCTFLNRYDLIIGESYPGVMLGYDQTKYVITNHDNTSDEGFLIREAIGSSTDVDFPVGNAKNDYTPARINNAGTTDTFKVRVFPNVYENGNGGQTADWNPLSVQRTWNIIENTGGGSIVDLTLQHNAATEGSRYVRSEQYISRYWGSPNTAYYDTSDRSKWDYANPSNDYANTAGNITTGSNVGFMATRSKTINSSFAAGAPTRYFTKASSTVPLPVSWLYINAVWKKITPFVTWSTASEDNNSHFEVYRSYDGQMFEYAGTVLSKSDGGNSSSTLNYEFLDVDFDKNHIRPVYYKVKQIDYDGKFDYSRTVTLRKDASQLRMQTLLYPNPARNQVQLSLLGIEEGEVTVRIYTDHGKLVQEIDASKYDYREDINISLENYATGFYMIYVHWNEAGRTSRIHTEKLIVHSSRF
jgi:hypothetical protein